MVGKGTERKEWARKGREGEDRGGEVNLTHCSFTDLRDRQNMINKWCNCAGRLIRHRYFVPKIQIIASGFTESSSSPRINCCTCLNRAQLKIHTKLSILFDSIINLYST